MDTGILILCPFFEKEYVSFLLNLIKPNGLNVSIN